MKATIKTILCGSIVLLSLFSCSKPTEETAKTEEPVNTGFIKYTIKAGQQYCDLTSYKQTEYTELKFIVRFDSSAIYQTLIPDNQLDVNKLYGFADNDAGHQQYSARIGWRWSDGALRLFGYTYNNGIRDFEEISTVSIGQEHICSIKISSSRYIFSVGNAGKTMTRASTAPIAKGYKLYPFFGGDETAPHDIHIWIKEL